MPDIHSGYGFAIGNMAAFDTADPSAVVSPGMLHAYHMHVHMYITQLYIYMYDIFPDIVYVYIHLTSVGSC